MFVSYRRAQPVYRWVTQVFVPILRERLPESLGRDAQVFLDEESIDAGTLWPESLEQALVRSRCVVPIFNPSYFQRDWCVAEFATMIARMEASGVHSIVPIQFSDGDFFDDRAKKLQWIRMEDFNELTTPSRARNRVAFMREIRKLCDVIAERIKNAPPFDPAWHSLVVRPPPPAGASFSVPGFGGAP